MKPIGTCSVSSDTRTFSPDLHK